MSYEFEWDYAKAESNLKKHGVSFEEAVTVLADPLSLNMPDPAHSADLERFLVLGMSARRGFSLSPTRSDRREHVSSAHAKPLGVGAFCAEERRYT